MSDPFRPIPQNIRPPGSVQNLQSRITRYAREHRLSVKRLNQRIQTEVILGVLERAKQRGIIPMYLAKGGMALELRFGIRARASGDFDVGIVTDGHDLLELFDRVLEIGFDDFAFVRRGKAELLENAATYRLRVQIAYRGRPFGTLSVDLNEASHETATTIARTGLLTALGLPGPLDVPLLEVYLQIAQKLHGATEPDRPDYTNRRHRDLLDVLVMVSDATLDLDLNRLRAIAVAEFARRPHNTNWPPIFSVPDAWRDELTREAKAIQFETIDSSELGRQFIALIAAIEGIPVKQTHEYRFLSIQMNLSGTEPVEAQASSQVHALAGDGWRMIYVGPRHGMVDQFLAILERPVDVS